MTVDSSPEWVSEHIADIDEQIALLETLVDAGHSTLTVDLHNYLSLHTYTRNALDFLRTALSHVSILERKNLSLAFSASWPKKRPRGRPSKKTLAMTVGSGLLGILPADSAKTPKSRGRPRTFPTEFLEYLNDYADELADAAKQRGERITLKGTLRTAVRQFAEGRMPPGKARDQRIEQKVDEWYKPLSAYRVGHGIRLRTKSKKSARKSPNFEPLQRFWRKQ